MSRAFVNDDWARAEVVPVGTPEDPAAFAARFEARLAARQKASASDQPTDFHQ